MEKPTQDAPSHAPPSWVVLVALLIPPFLFPTPGAGTVVSVVALVAVAAAVVIHCVPVLKDNPTATGLMGGALLCLLVSCLSLPNTVPAGFADGLRGVYVFGVLMIAGGFLRWTSQVPTPMVIPVEVGSTMALVHPSSGPGSGASGDETAPEREAPPTPEAMQSLQSDVAYLEQMQYNLLKVVPSMVAFLSESLRVQLVNQRFRDYFKLVPDEESGRELSEILPNKELVKTIREQVGKKGLRRLEFEHYVKKLGERRLQAQILGEQKGLIMLALDEVKTSADLATRLPKTQIINMQSEKLQLAGGMLEEMIESLGPLISQITAESELLLGRPELSREAREITAMLRAKTQTLSRILKTFQSFAEKHLEKTEEVGIVPVLEEALDPKYYSFDTTRVTVRKEFGLKRPKIDGSKSQLRQAFTNLFANAFEALERGAKEAREIEVRVTEDAGKLIIDIADNGCGIGGGDLKEAMKGNFSAKSGGGGMGLSVAQRIIFSHRGNIMAASEEGEGTVLTVQLPTA